MRWRIAVLGLLFLAACQQAPGTAATQTANPSLDRKHGDLPQDWSATGSDKEESRYFEVEEKDLSRRVAAGLVSQCYSHVEDDAGFESCVREKVIDAFDDSGEGRQNCRSLTDLPAFVDCIVLGNAAVDMLHRMNSDVKIDAATWAGRRSFADTLTKVALTSAILACGDVKSEAAAKVCVYDWFRNALNVPDTLASRCGTNLSDYERNACLAEASIIRFMQDHVSRMHGIGI